MLFDKLKKNNKIPFHMPGHKRNTKLLGDKLQFDIDVTEICGFDNLHNPQNIILNIENKIKNLYSSKHSFLLINGSTCGILAAVNSVVKEGDKVLVARNCHQSVYNAIELSKGKSIYINPTYDEYGIAREITAEDVNIAIEVNSDIKLIIITSPTYEGVISDVSKIADIAHQYDIPVLVDSAHGAHFFNKTKADITIMSLHKTLPALTQCAVAHINSNLIDIDEFRHKLSVFETSSPSYILMSSIENCVDFVNNNKNLFDIYYNKLNEFYKITNSLKNLKVLRYDDCGKLIIFTGNSNINGHQLSNVLRDDYNIEIEMAQNSYILAMTSFCDDFNNYLYFAKSLLEIDSRLKYVEHTSEIYNFNLPVKYFEAHQISKSDEIFNISDCLGKVSCEYVWAYPPGIPLLVPGEYINEDILKVFNEFALNNIDIHSTYSNMPNKLMCKSV